jgi:hypothetical protein
VSKVKEQEIIDNSEDYLAVKRVYKIVINLILDAMLSIGLYKNLRNIIKSIDSCEILAIYPVVTTHFTPTLCNDPKILIL